MDSNSEICYNLLQKELKPEYVDEIIVQGVHTILVVVNDKCKLVISVAGNAGCVFSLIVDGKTLLVDYQYIEDIIKGIKKLSKLH